MTMLISQETIKPSSTTHPHPKTHNLSLLDHFAPNIHMTSVFFYQNFIKDDINILKKSLSECLTQYYPFAGRFLSPNAGYIECNDEGVEFLEAFHDSPLDDFLQKVPDEVLYQLVPNGLGCIVGKSSPNFVEGQLTHFSRGGAALAISMSHKVTDGFTGVNFFNQWARVTRGESLINMNFFSSATSNDKMSEFALSSANEVKYVTRRFVFPNSKLIELKKKVISMGMTPTNPTRVEVLTSLIFKCTVDTAATDSGFFKPLNLLHTVNMRNKIIDNDYDPEKAAGNFCIEVSVNMADSDEIRLNEVVSKLRKEKMKLEGLKDVKQVAEDMEKRSSMLGGDPSQEAFMSSSLCGFSFYGVDFGWGKPVKVAVMFPNVENKGLFLADTPNRDGIEAIVHLPEEEMGIFQQNKELLAYVDG